MKYNEWLNEEENNLTRRKQIGFMIEYIVSYNNIELNIKLNPGDNIDYLYNKLKQRINEIDS